MSLKSKLSLKNRPAQVVGAPAGFSISPLQKTEGEPLLPVFVKDRAALRERLRMIVESASSDRLTWVAYPKAGQLDTDLNRDSLAELLTLEGVRPVTQIAIDTVWSALRFRPGNSE